MNGKRAKEIRKHVREKYPFMSVTPIYEEDVYGTRRLGVVCQRAFVQDIKKNYKLWKKETNK